MKKNKDRYEKARELFLEHGGVLKTSQALELGIHPSTLYQMRDDGRLETIYRGVYRLADLPPMGNPDLATVASCIPRGVICLISALEFHDITTQMARSVYVAIGRNMAFTKPDYPPTRLFRFSKTAFETGAQTHKIDGVDVKIYDMEKTVVDCFRLRNKLGLDVALEALKEGLRRRDFTIRKLMEYAETCRIQSVIQPYVEGIIA